MEYLDGCSTAIRHVAKKVGLYNLEMISLWGCNFQMDELAYNTFQQFMNDIFSDLLDICVIIYLDNILIYSNNMFKHHWHIKEVLKHLHKAGLYAKAEKCEFHSESVEYLGYILSFSSLTMFDNKVKNIQD